MVKLIPFNQKVAKQMGIVNTKKGLMVEKTKLSDNKKFQKPEKEEVKELKKDLKAQPKPRLTVADKERLEKRGVY